MDSIFDSLRGRLEGEFHTGETMRRLYATDASAYREMPKAVVIPKTEEDIRQLILFAGENGLSLIPRTAGTSLAGQVVGSGIIVDVSKHFTQILEINPDKKWVRVQPGVIRDELNIALKPHRLFFGPETSTSNRCMMGGMVGNNSCGARSMIYGSTREHTIELRGFLSDGNEVVFRDITLEEFEAKCRGENVVSPLEQEIYLNLKEILSDPFNKTEIENEYPKPDIPRRNTGYALDLLLRTEPFSNSNERINLCKLIAGSEGTLFFITEIKLNCVPALPPVTGLHCLHFDTLRESLEANTIALKYHPSASELIDHYILDCTKNNIEQSKNRFFVQGEPKVILVVEFLKNTQEEVLKVTQALESELREKGLGYHYPVLFGEDTNKIWNLRKAGLGLLSNIPGDAKPVPVIEDTAVDVYDLPDYIDEFNQILAAHGLYCVHYAHAGSGEIHLRPILDLKTAEGTRLFRVIAEEIAALVKKYKGSLSGEHGDGRLRGEFIRYMIGEHNYELCKKVKYTWDPKGIFNPGKIVDTVPMDTFLRFSPGQKTREFDTLLNFEESQGLLRAAEQCNGSGDCRKTQLSGGVMCPSYMATRSEKETTRARANILREMLTHSDAPNPFAQKEIAEVMDLCLSCKGCKSECPSNVDVAKLKAEYLYQSQKTKGVPLRSRLIAELPRLNTLASKVPGLFNWSIENGLTSGLLKKTLGFAKKRSIPAMAAQTLEAWYRKNYRATANPIAKVHFFCDEFTHFNDVEIGKTAILLLQKLGVEVILSPYMASGRTYISKGLLEEAKNLAEKNVAYFADKVNKEQPLIGLEPSAILTFRDEYVDLLRGDMAEKAKVLIENIYTIMSI